MRGRAAMWAATQSTGRYSYYMYKSLLFMGGITLILEWCCLAPLAVVPGRAAPLGVEIDAIFVVVFY